MLDPQTLRFLLLSSLSITFASTSSSLQREQVYSAEQSALINAAYSTLSKPYSRGLYLVRHNANALTLASEAEPFCWRHPAYRQLLASEVSSFQG